MDESQLKAKIVEWLTLRGEVSVLEKAQQVGLNQNVTNEKAYDQAHKESYGRSIAAGKHPVYANANAHIYAHSLHGRRGSDLKSDQMAVKKTDKPTEAPMHEDIVAGIKLPHLLKEHTSAVPHDHPHRELAAKFVADVWKKNKDEGRRMSQKYLGIGADYDPSRYGNITKSLRVEPAGISDPMQHNRIDNNEPKIANSPNKINPFRNIMKSLQKRNQR